MTKKIWFAVAMISLVLMAGESQAGKLINENLPKWVQVDLQFRYRYEYNANADFNDLADDNKGFSLKRTRLNITLTPIEEFKLFYQFQDSRIESHSKGGSTAGFADFAETRQLWAQLKKKDLPMTVLGLSGVAARFGRQEFSYGAQRLLGGFNWSNVAQTFDSGKIILDFEEKDLSVDIFAGGKTPNKSPREANDFFDGGSNDRIAGYYATYKGFENAVIEQYVINRKTNGKTVSFGQTGDGEVDDYTVGARVKGKISDSNVDYEFEAAKQFGNSGSLDVDAQMLVAIFGYTFVETPWKPRVAFEFDYGSGDSNSTDDKRETFDNLYPTNHLFYGYMDLASLQNINNYRFQIKAKPTKSLGLQADLHLLYLNTASDNLYSAGRTIKRATVAGANEHVGNEIDLKAVYKLCEYSNVLVGYSHLFPGAFLKDTGSDDSYDFFYVQTVLNF